MADGSEPATKALQLPTTTYSWRLDAIIYKQ